MKEHFFELADRLARELPAGETLLCNLAGERSDFVRFTRGRVRQAGSVDQCSLSLRLVRDRRQAAASLALSGNDEDLALVRATLARLRATLDDLPEDPWLLIAEAPRSTSVERPGALPAAEAVIEQVVDAVRAWDFVGIYAGGPVYRGFANSLGQRNWHAIDSFHFDWSLQAPDGQAVKSAYAGFAWDPAAFAAKVQAAAEDLGQLAAPPRAIEPGEYRAYLGPRAMEELIGLLASGGFSARAHATRQSPLLRMTPQGPEQKRLSAKLTVLENTREGIAPGFQRDGFVKPERVTLIEAGGLADTLVSPRSAKEYGLETNAANGYERPDSLDVAAGGLDEHAVLRALDTGLYVANLWYLNFSDRAAGRITGMTRFAAFWVERGRIVAPVGPMRFDDTVYRMLGENLLDLTSSRELLLDPSTYEERSTSSARLPGALLKALRFTL